MLVGPSATKPVPTRFFRLAVPLNHEVITRVKQLRTDERSGASISRALLGNARARSGHDDRETHTSAI